MENKQEIDSGIQQEFNMLVSNNVKEIANCFAHFCKCKPKRVIGKVECAISLTIWEFRSKFQNHRSNFPCFEKWMADARHLVKKTIVWLPKHLTNTNHSNTDIVLFGDTKKQKADQVPGGQSKESLPMQRQPSTEIFRFDGDRWHQGPSSGFAERQRLIIQLQTRQINIGCC